MREQVRDRGRLEHILQAIDKVFEFTKDVKREDFKKDSILCFAIVKNIEIIGAEEVWNVIEQDLQPLKEQVEHYLAEME